MPEFPVFSQLQTYWEMLPTASSRLVQLPVCRHVLSAQVVDAVLQVEPVKPGGHTHCVGEEEVSLRRKHIPPLLHSEVRRGVQVGQTGPAITCAEKLL